MTGTKQKSAQVWTPKSAVLLWIAALAVGIGAGWLLHFPKSAAAATPSVPSSASTPAPVNQPASPDQLAAQMKAAADQRATPLLEQLKSNPENPDLLASVGNLYYDAQQYTTAVKYYEHSLKSRPADASVRTDMATAYWYLGDADTALAQFDQALTYAPNNPNTLLNRGIVRWKGKSDPAGALADWKKILATSPNYDQKAQVEQLIAQVSQPAQK